MTDRLPRTLVVACALLALPSAAASAATYYVSSATGNDGNAGTSPSSPFATIGRVNALVLQPGDEVRFFCGETWRAQPLIVTRSGAPGSPIFYSTHPGGCSDKPILSGAQPIDGWAPAGASLYAAALSTGSNAARFPQGLNQLFRGSQRLPMGRWPNLAGHPDGGYAEVDAQPAPDQIADAGLPPGDWTGAVMHIKGIRWYMLNREVVATSGSTLTLGDQVDCWGGCAQWGYFLNSHILTLDREGEWYYDAPTNTVFLWSSRGAPANGAIEGSAILTGDGTSLGGVIVGRHLQEHVTDVTIEDLRIERWFDAGITTPTNLEADENQRLVISGNEIRDVDGPGIRLATWVWDAANNGSGPDGWRGGRNQVVSGNLIERANHFGIDTFTRDSELRGNTIRDVARIENLGRSGMGCGYTGTNCTEHGAGIRLNVDRGSPAHTGLGNTLEENRIERVGMQGMDVFGSGNVIRNNVIDHACISKGDCGAIRTFGNDDLGSTLAHDITIEDNVIRHPEGNTDGCAPQFEAAFGFGIYVDNYSRNVAVRRNTVVGATWCGVLFQRSTGQLVDNVLYANDDATDWGGQLNLVGSETRVDASGNVLFSLAPHRHTFHTESRSNFASSSGNHVFSPTEDASINSNDAGGPLTLAGWQAFSGLDVGSVPHFYNQAAGSGPRSRALVNDSASPRTFSLASGAFVDLDQVSVGSSVTVPAFSSQVVVGAPLPATEARDIVAGEGAGPSNANRVRVFDGDGSTTAVDFLAYQAGGYGANVGSGSIAGDGTGEILTGPGPGAVFGPQVRAFDRDGASLAKVNYYAYGTLKFGVNVGAAILDGDAFHEVVTGAGPGDVFGPHVRGWNVDGGAVAPITKVNFFAYATLKYGVGVQGGDVEADGFEELLTGPGPGQVFGAQVRGFDVDGGAATAIAKINFVAHTTSFGARVAAGDVELDGYDEIATSPGAGPANLRQLRAYDYDGAAIAGTPGFDVTTTDGWRYGGRIALGDADGDRNAELLTAPGPDPAAAATVSSYVYDGLLSEGIGLPAFTSSYGANVATGRLGH